jgi:plastocyanin
MRALLACAVACLALSGPAYADGVALAAPEAETVGFATPVVVVPQGQALTFVNADPASYFHNLFSTERLPKGTKEPWCASFAPGQCPRFYSDTIEAGQTAPVTGVPKLAPGSYDFVCTMHGSMMGTLIVN